MADTRAPDFDWWLLFAAWAVASVATLGSLFFSEVMGLPPCSLCWYQRIFMFPLPLVLGVALVGNDRGGARYALPLVAGGLAMALWHTLLYAGVLPEQAAPCSQGVSCSAPTFELFGVLGIPALSLIAFAGMFALTLVHHRRRKA